MTCPRDNRPPGDNRLGRNCFMQCWYRSREGSPCLAWPDNQVCSANMAKTLLCKKWNDGDVEKTAILGSLCELPACYDGLVCHYRNEHEHVRAGTCLKQPSLRDPGSPCNAHSQCGFDVNLIAAKRSYFHSDTDATAAGTFSAYMQCGVLYNRYALVAG